MPPKRKKSTTSTNQPSAKRKTKDEETPAGVVVEQQEDSQIEIHELYRQCIKDSTETERLDMIRKWVDRGVITNIVWPFLVNDVTSKEYFHGCHLLVTFIDYQFLEGSFGDSTIMDQLKAENTVLERILESLLYKTDTRDHTLQSQIVNFLIVSMASSNEELRIAIMTHISGPGMLHWIPPRRRELELKKSAGLRRKFISSEKGPMWIVNNIHQILSLLEGHSDFGPLVKAYDETAIDVEDLTMNIPIYIWTFLHRSLEFLIDLLSATATRFYLFIYLDSIHFTVRCRLAVGHRYATPENLRLIQHLLGRIHGLLSFPLDGMTQKHLSKVDVISMHHQRATILQKMAYRYYPEELKPIIYAGLGLLCGRQTKNSYLEQAFIGFADDKLLDLLYKMRLVSDMDQTLSRNYLLQILGNYLAIPPYPMDQIRAFPLYPTEALLWDHSIIPPSSSALRSTQVLALPKLNSRFLSFQDYLKRNFELVRLESAYEVRSDLVNVVKRLKPVLRQSDIDDNGDIVVKTEFNGWSRMALELAKPVQIIEVKPPKLGETIHARVTAEFVIDLEPCGAAIRREWDDVGEFQNLFLVAIDASKMNGNQAPFLKDYHLHHGSHKVWDSDKDRRIPDEEDSTFCERYGITHVRGCMVVQVRNEAGTVLSEPGTEVSPDERRNTKRVFKVILDSSQYGSDAKSTEGSALYQKFNLVVRRHGRENNFKAVLETIRGLLEGAGSIDRVLPPWLQKIILGHGDPTIASYKSSTIKQYAINTVGVNKTTDFLDFGDTFLDEKHLMESFDDKVVVTGSETLETSNKYNFKLRFLEDEEKTVEAIPLPRKEKSKGNPVRFTPVQVEAIRSGLLPGLTLVVGPPGTGKTDVAVQIISSLYHTYPTQRTIIITHSNAALNDIFSKVMARGDIDERYFVRLGAGERDLETDSSHDFTKIGRVAYSIHRRDELLEQVQQLSESLGVSGKAQRGADGSPSYTCETAEYFRKQYVIRRQKLFEKQLAEEEMEANDDTDVSSIFPFNLYFGTISLKLGEAKAHLLRLEALFSELAEYRPFELLRSQRQRADYLITKQARIVAMTCTHAAIVRSNLIEIGFEYDNLVIEESAQMLEIESFIPCLLQKGKSDDAVSGLSRLKRVCMLGDHNQLPPVVKNASFASFSNLDQSLFARLIRLGVPYVQLDKQGRSRPEIMKLYRFVRSNAICLLDFPWETHSLQFSFFSVGDTRSSETSTTSRNVPNSS